MISNPVAIVDIGSNSVRLVVYSGPSRVPSIIFNEKVMAGLGRDLAETGSLSDAAQDRALAALARFRVLMKQMKVRNSRVVATAAARDAANGAAFLKRVKDLGFKPEILSGVEEARMAGCGVLSGIPDADGLVGDLGGGSLELARISEQGVGEAVSLPLGVLRVAPLMDRGPTTMLRRLSKAIAEPGLAQRAEGRPLYLVGGSWRALARLDMSLIDYPLPIMQQYRMAPARIAELQRHIETLDKVEVKQSTALSAGRVATLAPAALLLRALVDVARPSEVVISSFGIREGLLYDALDKTERASDPLVEAARAIGKELGRFEEHGALLDRWLSPVFASDPEEWKRLRLVACLLADVGWSAHPDFRPERGVDIALHGNWVGIDAPGRVMVAQALYSNFGGGKSFGDIAPAGLCSRDQLERARHWGLAMRLAQRLSAGVATSLLRSSLTIVDGVLRLTLPESDEALFAEPVERRLTSLANALQLPVEAVVA